MSEKKRVPELRFPEFDNTWNEIRLGSVFENSREKGNDKLPIYSVSQELGLVPRSSLDRSIQNDAKSDSNLLVKKGDLAYNMMRMWQGAIGIAKEDCMVSPAYIVLSPKVDQNSLFYLLLFSRKRSLYLMWAYSYGLTNDRLRLYYRDFSQIKLAIPRFNEQQKIAFFLTSVDQRIRLLRDKKAQLERYKKGAMQKIFAREIRFKIQNESGELVDPPAWEEKRLGELGDFIGGGTPDSSVEEYWKGNIPWISSSDLAENDVRSFSITRYISKSALKISATKLVPANSVLMVSRVGIGKFATNSIDLCTSQDFTSLVGAKNPLFLAYYFSFLTKNFHSISQGTSIKGYTGEDVGKMKLMIPSNLEQQKIASFLSAIDDFIQQVEEQIRQSQQFKKGLLQKMFV